MSNLPISVVILNHRNDSRLKKCLASVTWAAEIIILDHDSGFKCPSFPNLKIHPIKGEVTDFSAERNQGLKLAEHEWVLFLDSDEYLERAAATKLATYLNHTEVNGLSFRRLDVFAGHLMKWGEVDKVRILRLVRKNAAHFERPVHEVARVTGTIQKTDVLLYHEPHVSLSEFVGKVNTYAQLEAGYRPTYSRAKWWWEIILYPPGKFIYNYLWRLGFLDGVPGLIYAYTMSLHSLLVRVYLYEKSFI